MKSNYELLLESVEELNELFETDIKILMNTTKEDTLIYLNYKDENIAVLTEDLIEGSNNVVKDIIYSFYTENKKASSKEYARHLERKKTRLFKKMLKEDGEIALSLLADAKSVQAELDSLKEDLEWTRAVGRSLYLLEEVYKKKEGLTDERINN